MKKLLRKSCYLIIISAMLMASCQGRSDNTTMNQSETLDTVDFKSKKNEILSRLAAIKGKAVLGGIHNREPNSEPVKWTNEIYKHTGKYPALWSGDFLFQQENIDHRSTMIQEAIKQYKQGAFVNIMWHACNPAHGQPCSWDDGAGVLSKMSDAEWQDLMTDGTAVNTTFVTMMEEVAGYLQQLKNQGVVIMFRPFHEMNQGKFWWGGRPGNDGTAKLYRYVYDYMTKQKGLNNILWGWNIQDFETLNQDLDQYNPGNKYWDIVSLDVYDDASGFTQEKYDAIKRVAGGKPMGIGECQKIPSLEVLQAQTDWVFFMGWSELVFEHNSLETIKTVYGSDRVLMLGEKPAH